MATPTSTDDQVDLAALYQFLSSMNTSLLAQTRSTTNNTAQLLQVMTSLQQDVRELIKVLDITREKRFEEEINTLEAQLVILQRQIDDKKNAKVEIQSTSEKIKAGVRATLQEEARKKEINWNGVRQAVVTALFVTLSVALMWAVVSRLPEIGSWLKDMLNP